jgi:hypothetical protein
MINVVRDADDDDDDDEATGRPWEGTDYRAQTLPLWMINVVNEDDGTMKKMRASTW